MNTDDPKNDHIDPPHEHLPAPEIETRENGKTFSVNESAPDMSTWKMEAPEPWGDPPEDGANKG